MRLHTVVLFVALLCLVGMLTVHEETSRIEAGRRMGRMALHREQLDEEIAAVEAELATLLAPARLAALNDKLELGLVPLPPAPTSLAAGASAPSEHE